MRQAAMFGGLALIVGASAAMLHPMAALGLVFGVAAVVWVLSNALNATLAFIVVLVLRPADLFPAVAALQPAKLVGLAAIFLLLITKLFHADLRISRAPHGKWMLGLFFGVLLSAILSTDQAASMASFTDVFVKLLIMYVLVVHLVDTKSRALKLHLTLAMCTVGLAFYAVYQRSVGLATIEGNRAAFVGLLGDPNDLALVLLMYVPLFVELALNDRGARRLIWVLSFATLVTGVLVTVSRGGAMGLMAGLGLSLYDRGSLKLRILLMPALAAAVLGMILLAGVNDRSSGAINQGKIDTSSQQRLDTWQSGIRMTMHHPVFGVGLGEFRDNYLHYAIDPVDWRPTDAHNSFIKAAGETGLAGFIPFMAIVALCFRTGYRLRKAEVPEDSPMERSVRRSHFPAMAGFCVAAFFLSQCWGWFFFILFAQSAAIHEIWRPALERSTRSVLAHDEQERNKPLAELP